MSSPTLRTAGVVLAVAVSVAIAGCAAPVVKPESRTDPEALWESASSRHASAVASVHEVRQLTSDYEAIIRLTRDGELRGRAFLKLAELSEASGDAEATRAYLEQALHSGLAPADQRAALLEFGFVLDQRLGEYNAARAAYQQLINEHPDSKEAALAKLRLRYVPEEKPAHGD